MTAYDARLSSIGEILNRAIALYQRRFVPLFVILAVFAIPAGVLGAAAAPDLTHVIGLIGQLGSLPPGDTLERARLLDEFNRYAPGGWAPIAGYCFELLFFPLAHTALIVYAAGVLDGATATVASAYRVAVRRWLAQIVVTCAFFALALLVLLGFALAIVVVGFPIFAIGFFSPALERIVEVAAGLIAFAGALVAFAFEFVAWQMASISVAIDDGNPVRAIVGGVRRALDRPLLRRTLATALFVIALEVFGSLAILALVSLVDVVTHLTVLDRILAGSGGVVLDGLCTVFMLLYMRELRLRREGSDLVLAAAADTLPPGAADGDDGLDPVDRALIARFLARRAALDPRAAAEIAASIAERVRPKLRASFHYLNDVDLLEHLGR